MIKKSLFAIALAGVGLTPAFADCATSQSKLSQSQVNTILSGNYACGQKASGDGAPGWNELHNGGPGGSLVEQHLGGATVETVGSWSTSVVTGNATNGIGRVTYTYSGGTSYSYQIAVTGTTNCNNQASCTQLPQTYQFCGEGAAPALLNIRVSASALSLASCPAN